MVDVPENLAPKDGIADQHVTLAALYPMGNGSALFEFSITGDPLKDNDEVVGRLRFLVPPTGSLDAMFEAAHQHLIDALRQMLFRAEVQRESYAKRKS